MKLIRNRDAQFPLVIDFENGVKPQKFTRLAAEELCKKLVDFLRLDFNQDALGIISGYLKINGYDGLCNSEVPCGCPVGDLVPSGDCFDLDHCKPAYAVKRACKDCESICDGYDEGPDSVCFTTKKPEGDKK